MRIESVVVIGILSFVAASLNAAGCAPAGPDPLDVESTPFAAQPESLVACVARHVAQRRGKPEKVQSLDCRITSRSSCIDEPSSDLAPLEPLKNLRALNLTGHCIVDAQPIAKLVSLEHLQLAINDVHDIRPLGALTQLVSLGLRGNENISTTWGFTTQEPFSRMTRLQELDLDDTYLKILLPLEKLTKLRHLSLRNTDLFSVRMLHPLKELRTLHIDFSQVEDLSPLSQLTRLEELTLDGNFVTSLEPLRDLAGPRGKLRKVSAVDNCTTTCDALSDIEHDCANQRTDCEHPEQTAPAHALSVPVGRIADYVPTHLPIWTAQQVTDAFTLIAAQVPAWDRPRGNCDGRAYEAIAVLKAAGFPKLTTAYAFGNLRPLTTNDPSGFVSFNWHVAVAARVALSGGQTGYVVLDPALNSNGALTLADWYARLVDSRNSALSFSCVDYYSVSGEVTDPVTYCETGRSDAALDPQGNLRVEQPEHVRGTICYNGEACFPL